MVLVKNCQIQKYKGRGRSFYINLFVLSSCWSHNAFGLQWFQRRIRADGCVKIFCGICLCLLDYERYGLNEIVFRNKSFEVNAAVDSIVWLVSCWASRSKEFDGVSISDLNLSWYAIFQGGIVIWVSLCSSLLFPLYCWSLSVWVRVIFVSCFVCFLDFGLEQ